MIKLKGKIRYFLLGNTIPIISSIIGISLLVGLVIAIVLCFSINRSIGFSNHSLSNPEIQTIRNFNEIIEHIRKCIWIVYFIFLPLWLSWTLLPMIANKWPEYYIKVAQEELRVETKFSIHFQTLLNKVSSEGHQRIKKWTEALQEYNTSNKQLSEIEKGVNTLDLKRNQLSQELVELEKINYQVKQVLESDKELIIQVKNIPTWSWIKYFLMSDCFTMSFTILIAGYILWFLFQIVQAASGVLDKNDLVNINLFLIPGALGVLVLALFNQYSHLVFLRWPEYYIQTALGKNQLYPKLGNFLEPLIIKAQTGDFYELKRCLQSIDELVLKQEQLHKIDSELTSLQSKKNKLIREKENLENILTSVQ